MTNYEWLIKTGEFEDFLIDVAMAFQGTPAFYKGWKDKKYYGLNVQKYVRATESLQAWLQAEHKSQFYVLFNDVIDTIKTFENEGRITPSCAQNICDKLTFLEAKEIEK